MGGSSRSGTTWSLCSDAAEARLLRSPGPAWGGGGDAFIRARLGVARACQCVLNRRAASRQGGGPGEDAYGTGLIWEGEFTQTFNIRNSVQLRRAELLRRRVIYISRWRWPGLQGSSRLLEAPDAVGPFGKWHYSSFHHLPCRDVGRVLSANCLITQSC